MVKEYNQNTNTSHKIKGWKLKNLSRKLYNDWNEKNNYTSDLSKYLVPIDSSVDSQDTLQ